MGNLSKLAVLFGVGLGLFACGSSGRSGNEAGAGGSGGEAGSGSGGAKSGGSGGSKTGGSGGSTTGGSGGSASGGSAGSKSGGSGGSTGGSSGSGGAGGVSAFVPPSTPPVPPKDGLIAYYTFDEGSGVDLKDSSGNANNGKVVQGNIIASPDHPTPPWVMGVWGKGLRFDGTDDWVRVPSSMSLDSIGINN